MDRNRLEDALRAGDVDELLRIIDSACAAREWEELERLRSRCAAASEAGHQLWPAASRAAYLLALDAPAPLAGAVLVDGAGRFAPGPLPEVAAQQHSWADLAPHVPAGPLAVITAHERVVRGEDLSDATIDGPPVLELPLRLADWEPDYALAHYRPDSTDFPAPDAPRAAPTTAVALPAPSPERGDPRSGDPGPGDPISGDEVVGALHDAVRGWADESNGIVRVVGVHGRALDAIASIDQGTVACTRLEPDEAMALLAWAAASGGAYAPRPGAAAGRFSAWWVAGALTGMLDDWPPDPGALGDRIAALEWSTWYHLDETRSGWILHLAVTDPGRERAWAIRAHDTA